MRTRNTTAVPEWESFGPWAWKLPGQYSVTGYGCSGGLGRDQLNLLRDCTPDGTRPPPIRMTAFNAQPPDLQPSPLMDLDFAVSRQLVRLRLPHIRFLFIGSRLCSTLLSDPASRRNPCASLSLLLHQDVKRTFTSKMLNNARHTRRTAAPRSGRSCFWLRAKASFRARSSS